MKKIRRVIFVLLITISFSFVVKNDRVIHKEARSPIDDHCKCKGKKLYGKVKIVHSFPDIKVQVVESFPELRVKVVKSFPDRCGKWQMVESFPDFTVQFVTSFPDVKIKYVDSFPGKN